jgi:hypothetical protein
MYAREANSSLYLLYLRIVFSVRISKIVWD